MVNHGLNMFLPYQVGVKWDIPKTTGPVANAGCIHTICLQSGQNRTIFIVVIKGYSCIQSCPAWLWYSYSGSRSVLGVIVVRSEPLLGWYWSLVYNRCQWFQSSGHFVIIMLTVGSPIQRECSRRSIGKCSLHTCILLAK